MNTPFLTTRITLLTLFFVAQQSYGMELIVRAKQWIVKKCYGEIVQLPQTVQLPQFNKLSELPVETQLLIFKHSDNKSNFKKTNKDWCEKGSINSPSFVAEFYCLGDRCMCRIFLNAVWEKNYEGVENILKHYYANQPDRTCYYPVDIDEETQEQIVLDPYDIAGVDKEMIQLLQKYKVEMAEKSAYPAWLMMACLSGNSDFFVRYIPSSGEGYFIDNIKRALNIIVDCDHAQCMQQFIDNISYIIHTLSMESSFDIYRILFGSKLLRRACINKSFKTLKILLSNKYCAINEVVNDVTVLDEMLKVAEQDDNFSSVVALLQQYGAKTAQQLSENVKEPLFPVDNFF